MSTLFSRHRISRILYLGTASKQVFHLVITERVCSFVRALFSCLCVCLFARVFVRACAGSSVRRCVLNYVRSYVRSCVCSYVRNHIRPYIRSCICSFVGSAIVRSCLGLSILSLILRHHVNYFILLYCSFRVVCQLLIRLPRPQLR